MLMTSLPPTRTLCGEGIQGASVGTHTKGGTAHTGKGGIFSPGTTEVKSPTGVPAIVRPTGNTPKGGPTPPKVHIKTDPAVKRGAGIDFILSFLEKAAGVDNQQDL